MREELLALAARVEALTSGDRTLDGEIMFRLFAKPAGDRGFLWPEDNPSWSFAMASDKPVPERTKRRERHDAISEGQPPKEWIEFQHEDGRWILMNSLRVPRLTSDPAAPLRLLEERWAGWSVAWFGYAAGASVAHLHDGPIYEALKGDSIMGCGQGGDLPGRQARALTAALLKAEATRSAANA